MTNDFINASKRVDSLKDDLRTNIAEGVDEGMDEMKNRAREFVDLNDSNVSGELVRKIKRVSTRTWLGDEYVAHVLSTAPHASYVEYGTGVRGNGNHKAPDNPPVENIYEWLIEKGIFPTHPDIHTQRGLAHVIAQTIDAFGTHSHPYMRPAFHARKQTVINKAHRGMYESVSRF